MNILILYNSRGGNTKTAAEKIAQVVREMKDDATVKSVIEVREADIKTADALFIGTWTHGLILFNVRPAGADLWVPALPSLAGKPVGIFSTYAYHPRGSLKTLAGMLEKRGARIIGQQAFHHSRLDVGMKPFVETVLQTL